MTETATMQTSATATATREDTTMETGVQRNTREIPFDARRFRSELAMQRVRLNVFARASDLTPWWIGQIWNEYARPGELAAIKMKRGLVRLGIDPAPIFPGSEDEVIEP
jgi:hypothetical protein